MGLVDSSEYNEARKLAKAVVETAKDLNKVETAALFASTAGFVALAYLIGIVFLVFASMSGALLLYRFLVQFNERKETATYSKLEIYDTVLTRKTRLWNSELPEEEKKQLSAYLDNMLALPERNESSEKKQLLPTPRSKRQLRP